MNLPKKNTTVVVAMSGGVDSSVAAALLREEGYNIIGLTMKTYNFDEVGGNIGNEASCCGLDAINDARMVAGKLGVPHYVVDFTQEFGQEVIDNFVREYLQGRTPNPCVICNKKIKWGTLIKKAESLGAQYIATGHYARIWFDHQLRRYNISRPSDKVKDQTYALWGLNQEVLSKTIFPLGEFSKSDVRDIAARCGLKTAMKEESYEICFIADNDYRRFLKEHVADIDQKIVEGDIMFEGMKVGKHKGYPFYTIGQRSGIGSYGKRFYVTEIDPKINTVTIGQKDNLLHRELLATEVNFIGIERLTGCMNVQAQVRYKDTPSPAKVCFVNDHQIRVIFAEPKCAITPGQSVVLYDGERLIGGGVIECSIQ